jgi:hypothetical protein
MGGTGQRSEPTRWRAQRAPRPRPVRVVARLQSQPRRIEGSGGRPTNKHKTDLAYLS